MFKYLILIVIFLLFASCESKVEKDAVGTWIIDELYYKNQNFKDSLLANSFIIKKDNSCELPIVNIDDNHTLKEKGKWKVINKGSSYFLEITSTNELFRGTYKIETIGKIIDSISHDVSFKMKISNNEIKMFCSKIAFVP